MSCWRTKSSLKAVFIGLLFMIPWIAVSVQAGSWVPGVTPGWDGNGLAPFMDYVTQGEESVALNGLKLVINSPVLSLPGRGMDLNLGWVYGPVDHSNPYKMFDRWYWDLPHYYKSPNDFSLLGGSLTLPGGASYGLIHHVADYEYSNNGQYDEGVVFGADFFNMNQYGRYQEVDITLNDGTKFHSTIDGLASQCGCLTSEITSINGGSMKYEFIKLDYQHNIYRISKLTDSAGRVFTFNYDNNYEITTVMQQTSIGSKCIFKRTLNINTREDILTDALGRETTYTFSPDWSVISDIKYPNGTRSHYEYNNYMVSKQMFYQPGAETPYRTVNYSMSIPERSTTVDDGTCTKKYYFTYDGHTAREEIYTSGWKLLKRVTKDYTWRWTYHQTSTFETSRPSRITTELSDGTTMGKPIVYDYGYDDWGNTTYIKYPTVNGYTAETHLRYHNTKFNDGNFTVDSPLYLLDLQNCYYKYINYEWYNRIATKGTIVYDPVHNTRKLSQTHYDYDSQGNLTKERVVYGDSYLDTTYTYHKYDYTYAFPSFGNVKSQNDPNRDPANALYYDYSSQYKYAYKTRTYKADGTTLATYEYDFSLGKPTLVTDPKNNAYRYKYDAIGRVVEETLDNPDPEVGVSRILAYEDTKSTVTMFFGNPQKGWQVGRIEYDPLFGKPKLIKRLPVLLQAGSKEASVLMAQLQPLVSQMLTQKELNYDSNGRLAWEKDGMGHTTYHYYDELDREHQTKLPDGSLITYDWNYYNRDDYYSSLTITDAKNNQKKQYYDLLDRQVILEEHPNATTSYTTRFTYDSADHLVKTVNPRNAVVKNKYNQLGQLAVTEYPDSLAAETFTYDKAGNLKTKTGGAGTKTFDYEFYTGYRLKKVTEPDRIVDYTYDANDNIVSQSANGVNYSYTNYDARNRAHNFSATLDGNTFNFSNSYDTFGRQTGITYPNRANGITYNYDELDRLFSIPGYVDSCTYDPDNKLTGMLYANGVNNTWSYDPVNDRLTNIDIKNGDKSADRTVSGDFNGDGQADVAGFLDYGNGKAVICVWLSTGSSFACQSNAEWWNSNAIGGYTASLTTGRLVSGDFNQDGKSDIAALYDEGNNHSVIQVWLSTGSSFVYQSNTGWWNSHTMSGYIASSTTGRVVSGDFNNDGKCDIAAFYDYGNSRTKIHVWLSTGSSFTYQSSAGWWDSNGMSGYIASSTTGRVVSGDFNSDGRCDIAAFYYYGNNRTKIHVWLSTGSSFVYQSSAGWWESTGYNGTLVTNRVVSGDFNSDGKCDIAAFYDYASSRTKIHVWLSTGSSFAYQSSAGWWDSNTSYNASSITNRVVSGDFNRDGKSDIVAFYNYGSDRSTFQVWLSTGAAFDYQSNMGWWGKLSSLNYSYDSVGNITQIGNDYYNYDGLNRLTWAGN
ncbi:MAG TPA: FG-GAP-like repeat-containing protein, partial [Bacillota bacterium]|nr:FG-GAP-like repeat-containing protein [Bacillota bacterium]